MKQPTIWINAGEASGDAHGAALMQAFKEAGTVVDFTGMGGPAMRTQGFAARFDANELNLVGLTEIAAHLPRILGILYSVVAQLRRLRPAAVVLVDAPEFNFLLARAAYYLGLPVYYYVAPQVWAWRTGRVKLMRRYFRKIYCMLPFEPDFYAKHGVNAEYVGHPLLDELDLGGLDSQPPEPGLLGLMPGSRTKEVQRLLPAFLQAAKLLAANVSGLRVQLLKAPGLSPDTLAPLVAGFPGLELVEPEDRYTAMRKSSALLSASGTAVLEAALVGTPTAAAYVLSPTTYALAKRVIKLDYVTLPNLIVGRQVVPELLQQEMTPHNLAAQVLPWLADPLARQAKAQDLASVRRQMGEPGGAKRAAASMIADLGL